MKPGRKITQGFFAKITVMKSFLKRFILIAIFLLSSSIQAELLDSQLLPSLGNVKYHELKSTQLKRSFHIFVDLPEDYASSDENYPTIYLLDGGITFPLLAAYHRYLRLGDEVPAAIVVGITYGGATFEQGNMRSTDFTAAAEERDFWGGAPVFQSVLRNELLPMIESNYRSDPQRRVIFGQSIAGQFVLYTALTQPELFYAHIASNPALHRNLPFYLQWQGESDMPDKVSHLFVGNGELNDPRFHLPAMEWVTHWQDISTKPWLLETRVFADQTHFSAAPESFRQGLKWLTVVSGSRKKNN